MLKRGLVILPMMAVLSLGGFLQANPQTVTKIHQQIPDSIAQLQVGFFNGPICQRQDLMPVMPEQMPKASRIGVQTHFNQAKARPWFNAPKILPYMQALGVKWIRDGLNWHAVDSNYDNVYETPDAHDQWVKVLDANGFLLLAPMLYGPAGKLSPKELSQRYVHYVSFMVDRFPNAIGAIQIWNEPNNFGGWRQRYGGKWYGGPWVEPFAEFLAHSSAEIRRRYPDLEIISGTGIEATTSLAIARSANHLDATYIHPYPRRDIPEFMPMRTGDANSARRMFKETLPFSEQVDRWMGHIRKETGNSTLGLWITEYGSSVYRPDDGIQGDHLHHPPVDRKTQAKTIARLMMTALESDIQRSFIFILADDYRKPTKPGFGLMTTEYDLKPSFGVFGRINALTRGVIWPDTSCKADVVSVQNTSENTEPNSIIPKINDIRVIGFKREDGLKMISFSAPVTAASDTSDDYKSVRATLRIGSELGNAPIFVDLLTGESQILPVKQDVLGMVVEVTVEDYPCL